MRIAPIHCGRVRQRPRALVSCDGDVRACTLPICAVCARQYRIYAFGQLRKLAEAFEGPHQTVTIYLDEFALGDLQRASLKRAHDFLRQRFNRAGLKGSTLVGGTEAAWQAKRQRWLLHVHLLTTGVTEADWGRLDEKGKKGDVIRAAMEHVTPDD